MQDRDDKDTELVGTSDFPRWSTRSGRLRRVTEEDASSSLDSNDLQRRSPPSARLQVAQPPDEEGGASGTLRCLPAICERREHVAEFVVASSAVRRVSPGVEHRSRRVCDEEETDFGGGSDGIERLSRRDYGADSRSASRSPIRTSRSPVMIDRSSSTSSTFSSTSSSTLQPNLPPALRESPDAPQEGSQQRHHRSYSLCSGGQLYVIDETSQGVGSHPLQQVSRRRHYSTCSNFSGGLLEEIQQSFHEVGIGFLPERPDTAPPMPFDLLCESPPTPLSDSVIDAACLRLRAMAAADRRTAPTQTAIPEMALGAEGGSIDNHEGTSHKNLSRTFSSSSAEGTGFHINKPELDEERAWQPLMPVQAVDSMAPHDHHDTDVGSGRGTDGERPRAFFGSICHFTITWLTLITFIIFVTIVVFYNTGRPQISPSQTPPVSWTPSTGADSNQMPPLRNRVLLSTSVERLREHSPS